METMGGKEKISSSKSYVPNVDDKKMIYKRIEDLDWKRIKK
jgi:hypothetical protein